MSIGSATSAYALQLIQNQSHLGQLAVNRAENMKAKAEAVAQSILQHSIKQQENAIASQETELKLGGRINTFA